MNLDIAPAVLFKIGAFEVTNTMTSGLLMTVLVFILAVFIIAKTRRTGVPTKFQLVLEEIIEIFLDFIQKIVGSEKLTRQILPIIGTVFIYIGVSNVLTILPVDWIMVNTAYSDVPVPLFRTHTSDIGAAFGIAAGIVLWSQWFSIRKFGIVNHIDKYFKLKTTIKAFRKSKGDGAMSLIDFFLLGPLDLISEIAKSVSLSLRLFGNMLAGVFLTALLVSAAPVIAPAFLSLYGLFSGVIQAVVFGALSASYFASAVAE